MTNTDTITEVCSVCGQKETVPNKGLGRAKLAEAEVSELVRGVAHRESIQ